MKNMNMRRNAKKPAAESSLMNDCFFGSVTVGERGQVVIPAEARAEMGIQPGDKLLAMRHPIYAGVVFAKVDAFLGFIEQFKRDLGALKELEDNKP